MRQSASFSILVLILLSACTVLSPQGKGSTEGWAYWLENITPVQLERLPERILVIDPTLDGRTRIPASIIRQLRAEGKEVYAYLSIGEAEAYRDYWREEWQARPPAWLGQENPEWKGNYGVAYWHPAWERTILNETVRIMREGYTGLYLDKIDRFEEAAAEGILSEDEAAERMIQFIQKIREACRVVEPSCKLILQNGERLLEYNMSILRMVDGFALEDLWQDGCTPQPSGEVMERLRLARTARKAGKRILIVEYVEDCPDREALIHRLKERAQEEGFILTIGTRSLATPSHTPGEEE